MASVAVRPTTSRQPSASPPRSIGRQRAHAEPRPLVRRQHAAVAQPVDEGALAQRRPRAVGGADHQPRAIDHRQLVARPSRALVGEQPHQGHPPRQPVRQQVRSTASRARAPARACADAPRASGPRRRWRRAGARSKDRAAVWPRTATDARRDRSARRRRCAPAPGGERRPRAVGADGRSDPVAAGREVELGHLARAPTDCRDRPASRLRRRRWRARDRRPPAPSRAAAPASSAVAASRRCARARRARRR